MSDFADYDPEDAFDDADPVPVRLAVLERVVAALRASSDRREARRVDALRLVVKLEATAPGARLAAIRADLEAL